MNACIERKELTDGARVEIVRCLVDILFSKSKKPTRSDCIEMGRKLILSYPWMKDDAGIGPSYVSFLPLFKMYFRSLFQFCRQAGLTR